MGRGTDREHCKTIPGNIYLMANRMKKVCRALSDCSWILREPLMVLQSLILVRAFPGMHGRRKARPVCRPLSGT